MAFGNDAILFLGLVVCNPPRVAHNQTCGFISACIPCEQFDAAEFSFRQERLHEFSAQWSSGPAGHTQRSLTLTSLRIAYQCSLSNVVANADLNRKIASGVMGCLNSAVFDSTGLMKSMWLENMSRTADDAQGMLDELFSDDSIPPASLGDTDLWHRTNWLDLS